MAWQSRTLAEELSAAADACPDREALVISGERITYRELWQRVRVRAANLQRLGLRKGQHIAICLPNSIDWVVTWYAAATLGAVTVPVNTRFKADEIRYCLSQSDAQFLVTADTFLSIDFIEMLRSVEPAIDEKLPGRNLPKLRTVLVKGTNVPRAALSAGALEAEPATGMRLETQVSPHDVLLIQYTSGSTAFPKGVMLTHDNMIRDASSVAQRLGLTADDRYFYARPFYHVAGTTLALLGSLVTRCTLVAVDVFEPGQSLELMRSERCTVTGGNETIYLMLMNHPSFAQAPVTLRAGWAASSPSVSRQIVERFGMTGFCSAYGQSELSPNVWMAASDDDLEKRINGFAHPLPDLEVRLVDPDTGAVAGDRGEIQVRGWCVMKGYYGMPEQTARAIDAEGWLHTGDIGIGDGEGRFAFSARLKEVFRVGGENVAPAEVEDVLHRHRAVRQAQVVGVPHPRLGEVGAAFVVCNEGQSTTEEELIEWCKGRCANFRVPRHIRIIDSFERIGMTGSGKVQKTKLRAHAIEVLQIEERS